MVQVLDTLATLAGGEGFALHSSDGQFNGGLVNSLREAGIPVLAGGDFKAGLSTTFGISASGTGHAPAAPLPEPVAAPRVQLARGFA